MNLHRGRRKEGMPCVNDISGFRTENSKLTRVKQF